MNLARMRGALHYLANGSTPIHWRISRGHCPSCSRDLFLMMKDDPFLIRCLGCRASAINLSLIPVVQRHFPKINCSMCAYELSTYGSMLNWLRRNFFNLETSEYFPDQPLGTKVNGISNQDVQQLTFAEESFDLVTSNQVFEHVPDDSAAFRECYRVLRSRGALVFAVPLHDDIAASERIARLEGGRVAFYGKPEYHGSRLTGPNSVPTFWHFSTLDILDRVRAAGFRSVDFEDVFIAQKQTVSQKVIVAIK
jgi:SAM-dependent methyltransferase